MDTWAPIFSSITESSLWEEPLHIRILFITMLAKQDVDCVCRKNDYQLKRIANLEYDQVLEGLKVLSSPDPRRPNQPFEGRRIEKVEDGFLILNGEEYRNRMKNISKALYARKYRAKKHNHKGPSRRELAYIKAAEEGDEIRADQILAQGLPTPDGPKPPNTSGSSPP